MAASLLPLPRAVFYDAATGDALAGGFVYAYVPGGTTPKATWKDAGETTPNTNPIVLDASGSALIYGSGAYQLTVTDSLGNQVPGYSGVTSDATAAAGISAALVPFVGAATTTIATGLITFTATGTTNSRTVLSKLRDIVTFGDFGAVGDGVSDDTAFIQAAINECLLTGSTLYAQGTAGTEFKTTAQINVLTTGLRLLGTNPATTNIFASGSFGALLSFGPASAVADIENVGFLTSGTTTSCIGFSQGASTAKFTDCTFTGDLTGPLVGSQAAGFLEFWGCTWNCNSANTVGVALDGFNINNIFMGGRAQGFGRWLIIEDTSGANPVRGTKANAVTSLCTGQIAIQLSGGAIASQFTGCTIDQAGISAIQVGGGATLTQIVGGYWGLLAGSAGVPIQITASGGAGTTIDGVTTSGGINAISVQASSGSRVSSVTITGNTFVGAATTTLTLDSVNDCIVTSNYDLSTPTNGSWATVRTNSAGGAYTFGDNAWFTTTPSAFDSGSSYHCRPDRGITLSNKGVASSVSGTTIAVAHGMVTPPNVVTITQLGGSLMNSEVSSISGSSFTITYATSGAATFMWAAEYYS